MLLKHIATDFASEVAARTRQKWRHGLTRWERFGGLPSVEGVTVERLNAWRLAAAAAGLSARTIEDTISDVLTLCRRVGRVVDRGRSLRQARSVRPVPTLDAIAKGYEAASTDQWPAAGNAHEARLAAVDGATWWRAWLAVAMWTGLRLGDMLRLEWSSVGDERIATTAGKTQTRHVYPMCEQVSRHLEPLRAVGLDLVFPFPKWSAPRVRRELARLDPTLGPQALRRCSITQWTLADPEAGRIVHGSGLTVVHRHYLDGERVLAKAGPAFEWPECFGVTTTTRRRLELNRTLKRLPDDRIDTLLEVARAFR